MAMDHLRSNYESDYTLNFEAKKIFIGKSPKNEMTVDTGYGKYYDGNSVLLWLDTNKYVFIGLEIYSFISLSEIDYYISPIDNNVSPMPYGLDNENNVYLFEGGIIMKNSKKHKKYRLCKNEFPYMEYWSARDTNIDVFVDNEKIKNYYINDKKEYFSYDYNPEEQYDHLLKNKPLGSKMYIISPNTNEKKELNKDRYIEIINNIGNEKGLSGFNNKEILIERFG